MLVAEDPRRRSVHLPCSATRLHSLKMVLTISRHAKWRMLNEPIRRAMQELAAEKSMVFMPARQCARRRWPHAGRVLATDCIQLDVPTDRRRLIQNRSFEQWSGGRHPPLTCSTRSTSTAVEELLEGVYDRSTRVLVSGVRQRRLDTYHRGRSLAAATIVPPLALTLAELGEHAHTERFLQDPSRARRRRGERIRMDGWEHSAGSRALLAARPATYRGVCRVPSRLIREESGI